MAQNEQGLEGGLANLHQQGAYALLAASFDFLSRYNISAEEISNFAINRTDDPEMRLNGRLYRRLIRAYEDMGVVMATWYSDPKFLNESGQPRPVHVKKGPGSLGHLIRASRVRIKTSLALQLLTQSPSVTVDANGDLAPVRRVFVLPGFELPRAALFVSRYLETLQKNAIGRSNATNLLLERSCHVPEANLNAVLPLLRDIKGRGTAFMDSIDGDIEAQRTRGSRSKAVGELGVLVFAWTRPKSSN